jgi:NAD(P)-dependent dehydrogenase (short-subunit alcohol dehydrogenase family)
MRIMLKCALIVGASSGIGAGLVRRLTAEGYRVAAVARRQDVLEALCAEVNAEGVQRAWAFVHDVRDVDTAPALFDEIVRTLDGMDLVVYSAGVMPQIGPEDYDTATDKLIIDTNVIGAMSWLNLAARRFRVQQGGTIVGIGSVAGDRGRRGNPAYCASKAALHTLLESFRNRLSQHGVNVLTIKPGPVHTPMTEGRERLLMPIDVDAAVDRIFAAIARRATTVYVPLQWALVMPVIRSIPSVVFRRMDV